MMVTIELDESGENNAQAAAMAAFEDLRSLKVLEMRVETEGDVITFEVGRDGAVYVSGCPHDEVVDAARGDMRCTECGAGR